MLMTGYIGLSMKDSNRLEPIDAMVCAGKSIFISLILVIRMKQEYVHCVIYYINLTKP